ncbi:MAG TPA: hypothetical protein ENI23_02555 [bacterium]|nr:hypothetical protein [bacterium]
MLARPSFRGVQNLLNGTGSKPLDGNGNGESQPLGAVVELKQSDQSVACFYDEHDQLTLALEDSTATIYFENGRIKVREQHYPNPSIDNALSMLHNSTLTLDLAVMPISAFVNDVIASVIPVDHINNYPFNTTLMRLPVKLATFSDAFSEQPGIVFVYDIEGNCLIADFGYANIMQSSVEVNIPE